MDGHTDGRTDIRNYRVALLLKILTVFCCNSSLITMALSPEVSLVMMGDDPKPSMDHWNNCVKAVYEICWSILLFFFITEENNV